METKEKIETEKQTILVSGAAGFIGSAVCVRLLEMGHTVVGIDSISAYYGRELKFARLHHLLGVPEERIQKFHKAYRSDKYPEFRFIRIALEEDDPMQRLFRYKRFDTVIHLGAQAGVRYSLEDPYEYVLTNVDGFMNILEGCRQSRVKHLVYASSSSVYGLNSKIPYSEHDSTEHPVSLYAATKKSNEMMAHAYSHLYKIPTTGLRFFTVYGPWGRPDMSPFLFIDAILHNKPIKVFNGGDMYRDFTYIDDIVEGIIRAAFTIPKGNPDWDPEHPDPATSPAPYRIYNIGNQNPVNLMDFIKTIERVSHTYCIKEYYPMQKGDVYRTYADCTLLNEAVGFTPSTPLEEGIRKTLEWFINFYQIPDYPTSLS